MEKKEKKKKHNFLCVTGLQMSSAAASSSSSSSRLATKEKENDQLWRVVVCPQNLLLFTRDPNVVQIQILDENKNKEKPLRIVDNLPCPPLSPFLFFLRNLAQFLQSIQTPIQKLQTST